MHDTIHISDRSKWQGCINPGTLCHKGQLIWGSLVPEHSYRDTSFWDVPSPHHGHERVNCDEWLTLSCSGVLSKTSYLLVISWNDVTASTYVHIFFTAHTLLRAQLYDHKHFFKNTRSPYYQMIIRCTRLNLSRKTVGFRVNWIADPDLVGFLSFSGSAKV